MADSSQPVSPPQLRPRRSSYASYAQPPPPPPPAAIDGEQPAGEPAPYSSWTTSSLSADSIIAGLPPRRPSSGGRSGSLSPQPASDAHSGTNGSVTRAAVSEPQAGYMRAGTALGKAGFQARPWLLEQCVSVVFVFGRDLLDGLGYGCCLGLVL